MESLSISFWLKTSGMHVHTSRNWKRIINLAAMLATPPKGGKLTIETANAAFNDASTSGGGSGG